MIENINNYKCLNPNHQMQNIVSVCLNKECIQERICCIQCEVEHHQVHPKKLVDFYFMSYFQEMQRFKLVEYINNNNCDWKYKVLEQVYDQIQTMKNSHVVIDQLKYFQEYKILQGLNILEKEKDNRYHFYENIMEVLFQENNLIVNKQELQIKDQINQSQKELAIKEIIIKTLYKAEQIIKDIITSISVENVYLDFQNYPICIKQQLIEKVIYSQTIVICGSEGAVKLWDAQTQKLLSTINIIGHPQLLALSFNNQFLAIGICKQPFQIINKISIHNVNQSQYPKFTIQQTQFDSIIFSQNSQFLLTVKQKQLNIWSLWSLFNKNLIFSLKTNYILRIPIVSTNDKLISTITPWKGFIFIWNLQNRMTIIRYHHTRQKQGAVLCTSKDFNILISSGDQQIKIWKLNISDNSKDSQLELVKQIEIYICESISCANVCLYQDIILTTDEKYIININLLGIAIYDRLSCTMIQRLPFKEQVIKKNRIHQIKAFSEDMNSFITLSDQYGALIWKRIQLDNSKID